MDSLELGLVMLFGFKLQRKYAAADNLQDEEDVFIRSFTSAYQKLDVWNDLKLDREVSSSPSDRLNKFLQDAFTEEKQRFVAHGHLNGEYGFYSAVSRATGRVVGYVGVKKSGSRVYLEQLAVDPFFAGNGIGKALVFAAVDESINHVDICTRCVNKPAIEFYSHLGFTNAGTADVSGHDLDKSLYCCMAWSRFGS